MVVTLSHDYSLQQWIHCPPPNQNPGYATARHPGITLKMTSRYFDTLKVRYVRYRYYMVRRYFAMDTIWPSSTARTVNCKVWVVLDNYHEPGCCIVERHFDKCPSGLADNIPSPKTSKTSDRLRFLALIQDDTWRTKLEPELSKPYCVALEERVEKEYANHTVYPPAELIFNAFNLTRFDTVTRSPVTTENPNLRVISTYFKTAPNSQIAS